MIQTTPFFWLRERLRDVILWPINFIRDFPKRSSRIGQTIKNGFFGLLSLPSESLQSISDKQAKTWLSQKSKGFIHGLHLLLVQLFDLFGGPELAQFLMHLISHTTPLTAEETALISAILGPGGLRYQDVRIAEGGLLEWVFRVNGRLAFTTWYTINLPQQTKAENRNRGRQNRALLVHELIHVYQNEKVGTRYMTEAIYVLIKTRRNCYGYGGPTGLSKARKQQKQYHHFNREQQAQIVQDYFTSQQKQSDTSPYEPYILQLRQGRL